MVWVSEACHDQLSTYVENVAEVGLNNSEAARQSTAMAATLIGSPSAKSRSGVSKTKLDLMLQRKGNVRD